MTARRTVLLAALLPWAARADGIGGSLKHSVRPWLRQLDAASAALAGGTLAPRGWQQEVEGVLGRLELADLLRSLDFEALAAAARFPAVGEGMQRLYFLDAEGRLQALRFRPFLFTLRRDTAVVPHGHHNMATLHMVLAGSARARHFDRVASSATEMLIRPAADEVARPGHVSSISDDSHNIHWFEALSDPVFMFNIGVYQVRAGEPFGERDYVDAGGGTAEGGLLRARRLDRAAAYARYGHRA